MRKYLFFRFIFIVILTLGFRQDFASPADTAHYNVKHSYDVLKYKLDLNLYSNYSSPFPKSFPAKEIITFLVDTALSVIKLNAVNSSLQIDSVGLAGISFTHISDTLRVVLNRTYQNGEVVEVKICYQHKNVADNAFYASNGYVFADLWPENARKVFPCWDRASDKALSDITVKVPPDVRLGSTGRLADSVVIADTLSYHWVSDHPLATYLVTFSSKVDYLIYKSWWNSLNNPDDSIPIWLYHKPGESMAIINNIIKPLTDFFSGKFGDYPFEKIGFATVSSQYPYGGTENQTMVNLLPGGYSAEDIIAHEHAHQWFGDLITCGTWADVWLNEGFAMYSQKLWREQTYGYSDYKDQMNAIASGYLNQNPGWPIYNPEWAIHTPPIEELYNMALVYEKGACVLFKLRYVLGDSVFFNVMSSYASDTNFRFKNAVTEDFIRIVTEVSGEDMQWYFDEWVYAPNHPIYENIFQIDYPGTGLWQVSLTIEQVQTNSVFFRMPVEVKVSFTDGSDTLLKVMNDVNPQLFQWDFIKQPSSVTFDPDRNILLKQATTMVGLGRDKNYSGYKLYQNEPNPFTDFTTIQYKVPRESQVKISIKDGNGKEILIPVNKKHEPGKYLIKLTNEFLSPGIYLYKLESGKLHRKQEDDHCEIESIFYEPPEFIQKQ